MRRTTTEWGCDNPKCSSGEVCVMGEASVTSWLYGPILDTHFCCHDCLVAGQPRWYDDLCVEVTLADVVADQGGDAIRSAINIEAHKGKLLTGTVCDDKYTSQYLLEEYDWKDKICVGLSDGIAVKEIEGAIVHSPHSIVRLVCPTFAEACEHPAEFVAMNLAATKTHRQLSDQDTWTIIANKMCEICEAMNP